MGIAPPAVADLNPRHTHGDGFGLGLGIVRRLSTVLGFPVTVESTVGRGSTFGVEIPTSKVYRIA
jgi:signal transduction histidine kinase